MIDHKLLFDMFPVTTVGGVKDLLRNIHRMRERRYTDYAVADLLMDLEAAMEQARLTPRQRQVLHLHYEQDLKLEEVASALNISTSAVHNSLNTAVKKIADVFSEWEYGEVTPRAESVWDKAAI